MLWQHSFVRGVRRETVEAHVRELRRERGWRLYSLRPTLRGWEADMMYILLPVDPQGRWET